MDSNDKKKPNFKTKDLKQIEERFRQHRQARAESGQADGGSRKSMLHIAILVLLLGIATGLALYPVMKSQPVAPPKPPSGTRGPYLGDDARLPLGCTEVRNAQIPNIEGFPEAAAQAIKMQKQLVQEKQLPLEIENSIGMRFRLIPAMGTYLMGSGEGEAGRGQDEHQHSVLIPKEFYVSKFEVTQAQFEEVMGFNPSHFRSPNRPVEEVTWYSAMKFCENLCKREKLARGTYVLPDEEEWEYVCRANTQTPYYYGDDPDKLEFFALYSEPGSQPVGFGRPNAWGLHNMHGNVWEWCRNFHYDYKTKKKTEFYDANVGTYFKHAIRGGNFFVEADQCRSATRHCLTGTSNGNMLGFRVLRRITMETLRDKAANPSPEAEAPSAEEPEQTETGTTDTADAAPAPDGEAPAE